MSFFALLISSTFALGQAEDTAQSFYEREDYAETIRLLEKELETEPTALAYYNLGLAYAKLRNYPRSILSYERSLYLAPSYQEARHNLRLAYAELKDSPSDGRSLIALDDLAYAYSETTLCVLALICFVFVLMSALGFRLGGMLVLRKISFYLMLGLGVLCLFLNALLLHQHYYQGKSESRAILLEDAQLLGDGSGSSALRLPAGSPVFVREQSEDWTEVELADGRRGKLATKALELVVAPLRK